MVGGTLLAGQVLSGADFTAIGPVSVRRRQGDRIATSIAASAQDRFWPIATDADVLMLGPLSGALRKSASDRQERAMTRLTHLRHEWPLFAAMRGDIISS